MKILIVDDEPDLREILTFNLEAAGYETTAVGSAEEALEQLPGKVDLILLDVMLPGMSGYHLADQLRKQHDCHIPIIFLTAKSTENDLLTGFSAGGDDYISKPFSLLELLARVRAVLKRSTSTPAESNVISIGPITIHTDSMEVLLDNIPLDLSRKEYDILLELSRQPGICLSRSELISRLWEETPFIVERTVDVHIARIRNKLGKHRDLLQNKTGFGYYISK